MKAIIAAIVLFVSSATCALGADLTNGVFYVDKPVECHLIAQNGQTTTNQLKAGNTYMVGNVLAELFPTTKTTVYFSDGPIVEANTNSTLTINVFDQEVKNLNAPPRLVSFGTHNLSLTFGNGEFVILYRPSDPNSSLAISTPIAMYQVNAGKFIFQVSDQKSLVYVLDGMMQVHGDKSRVDSAKKGSKAITGQIDTETATTTRAINQAESSAVSTSQATIDGKTSDVRFVVIQGRLFGIWMK